MSGVHETIRNPLTTEEVTFVQTASKTNGEKGVVHSAFTETFEILEGELTLRVGRRTRRLGVGERLTVFKHERHTFWSESDRPTRFRGTIEPASVDLEHCFRIAFGLARDGLLSSTGVPRQLYHLVVLATMSQSNLGGPASVLNPIFKLLARTRAARDTRNALIRRYCPSSREKDGQGTV